MRVGAGGVWRPEAPRWNSANRWRGGGALSRPGLRKYGLSWHALLEEELGCPDPRVGMKPRDKDIVAKDVGHRDERHALMMSEKGSDDFRSGVAGRFAISRSGAGSVIDRLVEPEPTVHRS